MKDKEKQIEEMEFDLTMIVQRDYYGRVLFKETAERLIELGYRKNTDDVVLSKEELNEIIKQTKETEKNYYKRVVIPQERKETAEKILERGKYCMPSGLRDWIVEQFGVETNE